MRTYLQLSDERALLSLVWGHGLSDGRSSLVCMDAVTMGYLRGCHVAQQHLEGHTVSTHSFPFTARGEKSMGQ